MNRNAFKKMLVVGVEDGSFQKGITHKALLAAVLLRGVEIEDVKFVKVIVDGLDATGKITKILGEWNFEAIMLAGVSYAGFNLIDPTAIYKKFRKPVVIVSRTEPDNEAIKQALQRHFQDWEIRWGIFEKLGLIYKVSVLSGESPVYVETLGTDINWASSLIRALSVCGRIPEPIRVARLIARGLS